MGASPKRLLILYQHFPAAQEKSITIKEGVNAHSFHLEAFCKVRFSVFFPALFFLFFLFFIFIRSFMSTTSAHRTSDKIWTYSNGLSMLRAALTIPSAILLWQGHNYFAYAVGILAYITDLLDGWLARKLNEVSEMGKIIDPLADKIYVAVITTILVIQGALPLWFVALVIARDFVIMLAGIYLARRTGFVMPSNMPGKIAVFCMIVMMSCAVLGAPPIAVTASMAASGVMLLVSSALYITRFISTLQNAAPKP
jgi:CDP-diacylglycerol--glycerol-3-phosphate 3-phosphatidyltransferase